MNNSYITVKGKKTRRASGVFGKSWFGSRDVNFKRNKYISRRFVAKKMDFAPNK